MRISKYMLSNRRNVEKLENFYRENLPRLIERAEQANEKKPKATYSELVEIISKPWKEMVDRRPKFRSIHWNAGLNVGWTEMNRKRRRVTNTAWRQTGKSS